MAFREVTLTEIREVLRQWVGGASRREIVRRVGVDRNTVRRYVRAGEKCGLKPASGVAATAIVIDDDRLAEVMASLSEAVPRAHGEAWAACSARRSFISERLDGGVKLTKIRKLLAREGVVIAYSTLRRFAASELSFGAARTTIPVIDGEPGEELQVDTGWVGRIEEDGRKRRFRAWIFTAVRSRHRFVYPTWQETAEDAIEACEAAWTFFGGVFRVLVPDNLKAIVIKADPLGAQLNQKFLEYAQSRGLVIDPARVRSPQDKGRVERSVQTVRDDCFAGEKLRSLEDARRRAQVWCRDEYGLRRHSTTGRLPLEAFEAEEKERLLPAPTEVYEIPLWVEAKVARDQHAIVATALYSLPCQYVGRKVRARADRTTVRFYAGAELIKTHPRMPRHGRSIDRNDFPPEKAAYAFRDVAFLERQAAQHGAAVGCFARDLLAGDLPWTRMRAGFQLLRLAKQYGATRLDEACAKSLEAGSLDVRRLERMLKQAGPPEPTNASASATVVQLAKYLRPVHQYRLQLPPLIEPETDGTEEAR